MRNEDRERREKNLGSGNSHNLPVADVSVTSAVHLSARNVGPQTAQKMPDMRVTAGRPKRKVSPPVVLRQQQLMCSDSDDVSTLAVCCSLCLVYCFYLLFITF